MKVAAISSKKNSSFSLLGASTHGDAGGGSGTNPYGVVAGSRGGWSHHKSEFLGVGSSLPTISVGRPRSRTGITTSKKAKEIKHNEVHENLRENRGKGIDNCSGSPCASEQSLLDSSPYLVPQQHVGQRRLAHNGLEVDDADKETVTGLPSNSSTKAEHAKLMHEVPIPANKIREIRSIRKASGDAMGKSVIGLLPSGISREANNRNSYPDGIHDDNQNGKPIVYDLMPTNIYHGKAKSIRACKTAFEDLTESAENNGYSMNFNGQGWRTQNHTNQASNSLGDSACGSKRVHASSYTSNQSSQAVTGGNDLIALHDLSPTVVQPLSNSSSYIRRQRSARRKRKYDSTSHHSGEISGFLYEPEVSYCGSSWQPRSPLSIRTRKSRRNGTVLGPVVEIDEICSLEVRCYSPRDQHGATSSSGDSTRQLEADELLAHQLQEQLYNESPEVGRAEVIDATIAMSLQQEENARHPIASPITRRYQNNARIHLFGESEDAFHGAEVPDLSHIQRDFNENDYEMLLALDDNNHQHTGASEIQINSLPQSVVQTDNIEEPCLVCLEKPSAGDTIRHLPCLHKFHKDCIDQWLRRKTSCPVCKSSIK